MRIFDDIENSRLSQVDFVEAQACMLGCIGGPFYVENPYVARANFLKQMEKYQTNIIIDTDDFDKENGGWLLFNGKPGTSPANQVFRY